MSSNKKYWKSVEELNENSSIVETLKQNEFVEQIPTDDFLGDKDSVLFSILIGLPSLVLTKILAKSYPSAIAVA